MDNKKLESIVIALHNDNKFGSREFNRKAKANARAIERDRNFKSHVALLQQKFQPQDKVKR